MFICIELREVKGVLFLKDSDFSFSYQASDFPRTKTFSLLSEHFEGMEFPGVVKGSATHLVLSVPRFLYFVLECLGMVRPKVMEVVRKLARAWHPGIHKAAGSHALMAWCDQSARGGESAHYCVSVCHYQPPNQVS